MKSDGGELWRKLSKPIIVFILTSVTSVRDLFLFLKITFFIILNAIGLILKTTTKSEMAPDIAGNKTERKSDLYRSRFQHFQPPRNLKKESERLKTFLNWTVSFMDPKKLAENGFYYTNTEDVVRCAFCDVLIGSWQVGDVPEQDHLKHSPECPLINGIECGNLILQDGTDDAEDNKQEEEEEVVEGEVTSQDVCGTYGLEIRPFSAPERPVNSPTALELNSLWTNFEELGISKISGPVVPYYATVNSRLETFADWPVPEIQSPEKLAEAGFYYTSFRDNVLCFHCGGGLKNWEAEDDPWVEHAKWFSRCGFVLLSKGRLFVIEVLKKENPRQKVKESKKKQEENTEEKIETEKKKKEKEETCLKPSESSSTPSSDKETEQQSQSPNVEGKEFELCRICYVRERGIVFLPCGHFVSCTQCAPSLSFCAVCRKPFEATVRAYLS